MKLFIEGLSSNKKECVLIDSDSIEIFSGEFAAAYKLILRISPQDETGEYFVVAKIGEQKIFFNYVAEKIDPYLIEGVIENNDKEIKIQYCNRNDLTTGVEVVFDLTISKIPRDFDDFSKLLVSEIYDFWLKEENSARGKKMKAIGVDFIKIEK